MSHNWHMHIQKNQGELATAMAFVMASEAMRAKEMNVQMHIALSGGKTPLKIFQRLGFEKDLWTHVHFWWGDERMVPPDHPDSNAGHAVELFMKPAGVPASNIHRIKGELPPMQALQEYGKELEAHFGVGVMPQFDWIWLGLGVDGHTASLYSDFCGWEDENWAAIVKHPVHDQFRITLSPMVLSAGRRLTFVVTGENKSNILKDVYLEQGLGVQAPAARVALAAQNVEWYVDEQAAAGLAG